MFCPLRELVLDAACGFMRSNSHVMASWYLPAQSASGVCFEGWQLLVSQLLHGRCHPGTQSDSPG